MANDFPPRKDSELFTMAANAATLITATPSAYGLVAGQATTLSGLSATYDSAYNLAVHPLTRTPTNIEAKNAAKKALVQNLRDLNRYVQANKTVSDQKKMEIGFPVYAQRTPIPVPSDAPVVKSVVTVGRKTKMAIRGMEGERRGKPTGVQGALIVSYAGEVPPTDLGLWKIEGLSTRTDFEITWGPNVPANSPLWVSAAWYSPRGQAGPVCTPIAISLGATIPASAPDVTTGKAATEAA